MAGFGSIVRVVLCVAALSIAGAAAQDFDHTRTAQNPETEARAAAMAALTAHDYARAVSLLEPLAQAHPAEAQLRYDLGSADDALDREPAAETEYKAAIAADPSLPEAHVSYGLLLARAGRVGEAREQFAAAVALPEADAALRARALRLMARLDAKPRPGDARDELLAALKLAPETPDDTELAAELAAGATNGGAAAEAAYRRVLASRPGDAAATEGLAQLLLSGKRTAEAEAVLRTAVAAHPDDPSLTAQLASTLASEGKGAEALPLVRELYRTHPDSTAVARLLADLHEESGDYAAAATVLGELAARPDAAPDLLAEDGDALIHLHRYPEAEAVLRRAVFPAKTGAPGFTRAADLGQAAGALAFAASENNDPEGSLQALALRATVLPPTPSTLFLAAIAEDKLHRTRLAAQAYRDFLALSKGALPDEEFEARHRLVALEHGK